MALITMRTPIGQINRATATMTRQSAKIMDSSRYVHDFLEVPVMMIPCIQGAGRLDTGVPTFGQASAWGSLLPAVWSFMLALKRGLAQLGQHYI